MGYEAECVGKIGGKRHKGKLLLEGEELAFRGEVRLKLKVKELRKVEVRGELLRIEYEGGNAEFELGEAAEKWAKRMLNPPTLLSKLGVKPGMRVLLDGKFEGEFVRLLTRVERVRRGESDLLFFAAEELGRLESLPNVLAKMGAKGALWIVYPKGRDEITQKDVLEAGRGVGLVDTKVASFSATHTALRFSLPAKKK